MAKKYKIKITKAYHIAIDDKDGYEVASDWSFLDYKETKKIADKMLAEVEREKSDAEKGDNVMVISDRLKLRQPMAVATDCHLCGASFTIGIDNGETICPKCKDLWKEFIKSKEVR